MPSILFINRVYPPDSGATGRVLELVAKSFSEAGWEVRILATAGPGSPAGTQIRDNVTVIRAGVPFSKTNLLLRAAGYALMIPSLFLRALLLPRSDIVVTKTDPPMLLVIGPFLKLIKGSRLIHWAQDLYPEVAEEVGVLPKRGPLAGILRGLSSLSLKSHDLVLAVGRCMAEKLRERGIDSSKIRVVPNIGIEQEIRPAPRLPNEFRERHGLGDSFLVMYSGNMGRAHDFSTTLEAALAIQEKGPSSILFLFVGSGPMESWLRSEALRLNLRNVRFLPSQAEESLSTSLAAADLHLVTMKQEMTGLVVPSKFYGVLAAGRPCLFVGPVTSEVALVIRELEVGAVIQPGDQSGLADVILEFLERSGAGEKMIKSSKEYLNTERGMGKFLAYTEEILADSCKKLPDSSQISSH